MLEDRYYNKIINNIKEYFYFDNIKDIKEAYVSGGCFEFAYFYNKFYDKNSKIKILFGKYKNDDEYVLDMIHTFIEEDNGEYIDINGVLTEEDLYKNYKERYIINPNIENYQELIDEGDYPEELITIYFNTYNEDLDILFNLDYILGLEPYYEGYIDFMELGLENTENTWQKIYQNI